MLRGMCDVVRAVTAIRLALAARRDLLLEMLALHHQLAVLARSNRRFRTADRLLWLFLRRMWPQWHDALLLIQPATVDRWHRDRFDRRWWRYSRRPGRPRIDSQVRDLIQRLADENRLWGAPRIHGELLKLGVVVSERTGHVTSMGGRGHHHRRGAHSWQITSARLHSSTTSCYRTYRAITS
jgi:putative transposase